MSFVTTLALIVCVCLIVALVLFSIKKIKEKLKEKQLKEKRLREKHLKEKKPQKRQLQEIRMRKTQPRSYLASKQGKTAKKHDYVEPLEQYLLEQGILIIPEKGVLKLETKGKDRGILFEVPSNSIKLVNPNGSFYSAHPPSQAY